jgi:hypothetical protein
MASNTENVKIGVCRIYYDGEDLGYTKGGVSVQASTDTYEVKVDQFGESPISENITARSVTVTAPLAETTLRNMLKIMPGASLVTNGAQASGTITFSGQPSADDTITVGATTFTYKAAPTTSVQVKIGSTVADTIKNTVDKIRAHPTSGPLVEVSYTATVITIKAEAEGTAGNSIALQKSATNLAVSGANLSGGVASTKARVDVKASIGTNLLTMAKELRLRPLAKDEVGDGSEDFVIPRAGTAGALDFNYTHDSERLFNVTFKAYPDTDKNGVLFQYGDTEATAA